MNLSEAKAKFPIGSMVKVIDCGDTYSGYRDWARLYFSSDNYANWIDGEHLKNGDVAEVIAIAPHGAKLREGPILAGIKAGNKKTFIIDVEAIEPISFALDGENLVVAAYGETETYSLSVIIEELRAKCLKKKNAIKVGDKVRIVNSGKSYTTYKDWIKKNADFDQALMFDWGSTPPCGYWAIVRAIAKHSSADNSLLYLVSMERDGDEHMYLMAENGIEKI